MSNEVIMALLGDIIIKSLTTLGTPLDPDSVDREHPLIYYLEEKLARIFVSAGGLRCLELEKKLQEALKRDPEKVQSKIRKLIQRYLEERRIFEGPPDRFKEAREKARHVWAYE